MKHVNNNNKNGKNSKQLVKNILSKPVIITSENLGKVKPDWAEEILEEYKLLDELKKRENINVHYHIFHTLDEDVDTRERIFNSRKYITTVTASHVEEAFERAQNEFDEVYTSLGVRSTTIGDVIFDGFIFYIVRMNGIKVLCKVEDEGEGGGGVSENKENKENKELVSSSR